MKMKSAINTTTFSIEYTDSFGGEANYAWAYRKTLELPADISDLALVRRAKAAMGLTGTRCKRSSHSDTIELRPVGTCTVCFITAEYASPPWEQSATKC